MRGEVTQTKSLQRGAIDVDPGRLSLVAIVLSTVYGACMGTFALFSTRSASAMQVLASKIKVPALFFLTLLVTLPSLYVFNALVGSRLTVGAVVRLLVATLGVIVAVLASLGPIVAFFSVSTTSYPFILLFNVVIFGVSGTLGMLFLLQNPAPADAGPAAVNTRPCGSIARGTTVRTCRSSRPARRPVAQQARADDLPHLDDRVRAGGRPDGLGLATVRGQPELALHLVPRPGVEFLSSEVTVQFPHGTEFARRHVE